MQWLKNVRIEKWRDHYGDDRRHIIQIAEGNEQPGPHDVVIGWDSGKGIVGLVLDRVRLPLWPKEARDLAKQLVEAAKGAEGKLKP
jgi:hypothetical protein